MNPVEYFHPVQNSMSSANSNKKRSSKAIKKPQLDQRVLSLERDSSLGCLLVKGAAVPKREPNERLFTKMASLIQEHFKIRLMVNDVDRCYRLHSKQNSPIVIRYILLFPSFHQKFSNFYFRFNSSHEQSVFFRLTDPKLRPKMKEVKLFFSKLQSSFDSTLKRICDLLFKHGLLVASFVNKDSITCVKTSAESDVLQIRSKNQLREIFEDHEKFYLVDDIVSESLITSPPKSTAMEL